MRLDLRYDGTDFSGWAAQPSRRTVAGVLLAELARLFGPDGVTGLTVAGRTDTGVHASGQVAHIDVAPDGWQQLGETLVHRLAGLLPRDMRVVRAIQVSRSFDARFSALSRRYVYRLTDAVWGAEPLRARDTVAWPRRLDVTAMNQAAADLVGLHDFVAFCRRKEHASTIRSVSGFEWRRTGPDDPDGGPIRAEISADAFCQSMVRSLVGALIAVGEGRRTVTWPVELLGRTERASDVVVAPPHGLDLVEVTYPDEAAYDERARQTRNRRDLVPDDDENHRP